MQYYCLQYYLRDVNAIFDYSLFIVLDVAACLPHVPFHGWPVHEKMMWLMLREQKNQEPLTSSLLPPPSNLLQME